MLGNDGEQEEDCYHGDVEEYSTHITPFTDRRRYALWPSSLVWTCPKKRCEQRHPQSDGAGNTRHQTTRMSLEDMAPTDKGDMAGVCVTQDVALDRKE